jgi:hypothetical protein
MNINRDMCFVDFVLAKLNMSFPSKVHLNNVL